MGYARYTVWRFGHAIEAGYDVPDRCNHRWCRTRINRGLDHLCGNTPGGDEHGCGGYFCHRHLIGAPNDIGDLCPRCTITYQQQRLTEIADVLADSLGYRVEITDADALAGHPHVVVIEASDGFGCYAQLGLTLHQPARFRRWVSALPHIRRRTT